MTEYLWCRKKRIAALMLIAGLAGPSMKAALANDSTSEPQQQRIVACVNGIAIGEQSLGAAIEAAGEPDTRALRLQFKHRLHALGSVANPRDATRAAPRVALATGANSRAHQHRLGTA